MPPQAVELRHQGVRQDIGKHDLHLGHQAADRLIVVGEHDGVAIFRDLGGIGLLGLNDLVEL